MRKDKPCTGDKFGSESCPPGSKRYNLAKTFRKMAKEGMNEGKLGHLERASVLAASDDPKDQDKAREIKTRFDYESLKRQIGSKKKPSKPAVKEAAGAGVPLTPQELEIQKKMSRLNVRLAKKRSQQLQKAKLKDTEDSPEKVKDDQMQEGSLHKWFKGSKSKDGKAGWVNVKTGGTCASDEPGEGTPKCVSSSKRASMTKAERESASRRKKAADPNQQQKSGAAKPTYVRTDAKKKMNEDKVLKKVAKELTKASKMHKGQAEKIKKHADDMKKVDEACWKGYRAKGMKKKGGKLVPNCKPIGEAKVDKGRSDYGKASIRNYRRMGPGHGEPAMFDPENKRGKLIDKRREEHKARRGVKGAKVPAYKVEGYQRDPERLKKDKTRSKQPDPSKDGFTGIGNMSIADIKKMNDRMKKEEVVSEADKKGKGSGKKDACYHKVKASASVWPSAYASGRLVQCRKKGAANYGNSKKESYSWRDELDFVKEGAAWTKKSGKNPKGGLNEKGRKSYEAENPGSDLKAPSKKPGNKRRASFCARMKGMKKKLTSAKTARDPDSRINKSLRAWNCGYEPDGTPIMEKDAALDFVRNKYKGQIYDPKKVKKPSEADKAKAAAERKKRQDADNKAYASRAKKAGFKSTQDYTDVVARYGSEDNYRKGKGLGT